MYVCYGHSPENLWSNSGITLFLCSIGQVIHVLFLGGDGVSVPFIIDTALIGGGITLFIKAQSNQENTGDRRATPSSDKDSSYPESPLFLYISVAYTSPPAA